MFQDLDKRTLTAEEQAVIDSRVSLLYNRLLCVH